MTPLLLLLACTPDELPAPDQEPPVEQDSAAEHAADSGADSGLPSDDSMRDSGQACDDCPWSSVSAAHPLGPEDLSSDPSRTRDNPLKGFMTSYLWSSPANEPPIRWSSCTSR